MAQTNKKKPAAKKPATKKPAPRKNPAKTPAKSATNARAKRAANDTSRTTITGQVIGAYRDLRASFEAQLGAGYGEERLLAYVALACLLAFVAGIPAALRTGAFVEDGQLLPGIIAGRFVAMVLFGPLFLYGFAALTHVIAVFTFGGRGDYFSARVAFFWSLILGVPLLLIQAIALQAIELSGAESYRQLVTTPIALIWMWIFATGIAVSEGFSRIATFLLFLVVMLVIFGTTLLLSA